ncbi:MAG: CDP-4-dehydro-6-deoxyglucose reductase [Candidatus Pseudothioglobus sp.]
MTRFRCTIRSTERFNSNTRKVILELPSKALDNSPGLEPDTRFKAGQYLNIVLSDRSCPFSIASSPDATDAIELHIRPTPGSGDSVEIEALLDQGTFLDIDMPVGDCYIEQPISTPLILIAASTGISQMKSIIEFLIPRLNEQPIWLYWGVLSANDLYLSELCSSWQAQMERFTFVPVVSQPDTSPQWSGRTGLLPDAVLEDFTRLDDVTIYVSGGPGMVYATLDRFIAHGLDKNRIFSDVFSYAPRS